MLDLDVIYEPKLMSADRFSDIQRRVYAELGVAPGVVIYTTNRGDELERAWREFVEANLPVKKGE